MPGGGGGDQCQGGGVLLQQKSSTGPSRVVPHRSTTPARSSLTSLFGWEAVSLDDMAALRTQVEDYYLYPAFYFMPKHPAQPTMHAGSWQMLLATATARAAALAASAAAPHAATPAAACWLHPRPRQTSAHPPPLLLLPPPQLPPLLPPPPSPAPSPAPPCRSRRLHRRQGCSKHGRSWS